MSDIFKSVGSKDCVPTVNRNAVPDTTKIEAHEWSVLPLVDGVRTAGQIADAVTMPPEKVVASLLKFRDLGMINLPGTVLEGSSTTIRPLSTTSNKKVGKAKAKRPKGLRVPYPTDWPMTVEHFMFDPLELSEECDLSVEKRKQIIYFHYHLERVNYYQLFQIPKSADAKALKKAYFTMSKDFHPDRYFRKSLGPYKAKLEKIFGWMSKANMTLGDPKKRARYDQMLAAGYLGEWQLPDQRQVRKQQVARARSASTATLQRAGRMPSSSASRRARLGQSTQAGSGGRRVSETPARRAARRTGPAAFIARAESAETQGDWAGAVAYYERALMVEFRPRVAHAAARALMEGSGDLVRAESLCRKALQLGAPRRERVDLYVTLARILEEQNRPQDAVACYKEAEKLDPNDPVIKIYLEQVGS